MPSALPIALSAFARIFPPVVTALFTALLIEFTIPPEELEELLTVWFGVGLIRQLAEALVLE